MAKPKPSSKALGKRKAVPQAGNSKKAKTDDRKTELGPTGKPKRRADQPKKVKLRDQKIIPVPRTSYADDDEDSDDDVDAVGMDDEVGLDDVKRIGFLAGVDPSALSRSTKETRRLHELQKRKEPTKVARKAPASEAGSDVLDYDFDSDISMGSDGEGSRASGSGLGSDDDLDDLSDDEDDDEGSADDSDDALSLADLDDLGSDAFDSELDAQSASSDLPDRRKKRTRAAEAAEAEYEAAGRSRWQARAAAAAAEPDEVEVGRLPIKLPSGEVQMVAGTTRLALPPKPKPKQVASASEDEQEQGTSEDSGDDEENVARMATQKGRFGRLGVAEIAEMGKGRMEAAKEQIAGIGAEIMAGGELIDIGPTLTRLSTFALPTVPSPETQEPIPVPRSIRGLALLSQLAVYKDLIPGYRIRPLTEAEEAEKVRDEVRRQREGEKILVKGYRTYLKSLETEIKGKTPLAPLALKCTADLLVSAPHFNFAENVMAVLVARVGRRSWDADADAVLAAFIAVFRADLAGEYSRTLVRLLARMIKERKFQVHANVLACLLHLRLRTELDSGAADRGAARGRGGRGRGRGGKFGKGARGRDEPKVKSEARRVWRTKNERKRVRELKEIQKEMDEAEAEVDQEEKANTTLKDLFVLYFSIIKHPGRSPLLAPALEGISHFAHLINIDFFRDLLLVLRRLIADAANDDADGEDDGEEADRRQADPVGEGQRIRLRLLGIVTAFDLLSGQGEALNIDLADFINALYTLLRVLSLDTSIEDPPLITSAASAVPAPTLGRRGDRPPAHTLSTADLVFRCLEAIFFPRFVSQANASPAYRTAAFAKRLAEAALTLPPATARRALEFVRRLVVREPKLEALLDSEERTFDGVYKPTSEDPQLANPWATSLWEVDGLKVHWDGKVRAEAKKLADGKFA